MNVIQITPINPLNTNTYRSFISSTLFSMKSIVEVTPEYTFENSILIVVDGFEYKFENVLKIKTHITDKKVNLIRMPGYDFWNRVSSEFL